jgi:DNA polymerase-3 subunit epsilon
MTWRQPLLVALVALAFAALAGVAIWGDWSEPERAQAASLFTGQRLGLLVMIALAAAGTLAAIAWRQAEATLGGARKLAESVRTVVASNAAHRAPVLGAPEMVELANAVNTLAEDRERLRTEMAERTAAARADIEEEKNRLAALMSELSSSVLVCNLEGSMLLYNGAAKRLLGGADGSMIGLGRSVFGVLDRHVILHALDSLERQIAKNEGQPQAQFVTAGPDGGLVRVSVAPVLTRDESGAPTLSGYVLLLGDVTQTVDFGQRRDALLQTLTESGRAALANIRASIENLLEFPDLGIEKRARFNAIIRDEALKLSAKLDEVTREFSQVKQSEWSVEEMRAEDLIAVARARIERRLGLLTKLEEVTQELWLKVDSFSIAQAMSYLAARLKEDFDIREVRFRLTENARHAQLDLLWRGAPLSAETVFTWENDALHLGGEPSPLTVRDVLERHGGEGWYQRDLPLQSAYYRFVLPLGVAPQHAKFASAIGSRPEYYDFDLFRARSVASKLDDRALADLTYTVFDTETTGLDPRAGDEIISLGAARIVNGRLLSGESFQTLVDPRRPMSPESAAVHGITSDMLEGQPAITEVLPRFHRFASGTVLVAHNAAFDMRFLAMKEQASGVAFDQPVLDTLLLSAVAHPGQDTHSLESIAERLGVPVVGRHTALGDAMVTGEVFLRLLPLLAEKGVRTLREAREASEKTYYARVTY